MTAYTLAPAPFRQWYDDMQDAALTLEAAVAVGTPNEIAAAHIRMMILCRNWADAIVGRGSGRAANDKDAGWL